MSSVTPEQKAERVHATHQAAIAFVEDLDHVRAVEQRPDSSGGELRRLSVVARRLLVDGELGNIAAPRIGRFKLQMPDHSDVYALGDRVKDIVSFASGGSPVFGEIIDRTLLINFGQVPVGEDSAAFAQRMVGEHSVGASPNAKVSVALHNFMAQRVLCRNGQWGTRSDAIKYVANIASGAHTGTPRIPAELLISEIRHSGAAYRKVAGIFSLTLDGGDPINPFTYDLNAICPVLVEVLAALHFMATSPDIVRLERAIRSEMA
jgi:hypothetical protein